MAEQAADQTANQHKLASDWSTRPRGLFARFGAIDIERYLPRTLKARTSLIIVVPVILVQVISTYIFYENHWDTMSRRMAASLAGDVAGMVAATRDFKDDRTRAWIRDTARRTLEIDLTFEPGTRIAGQRIESREEAGNDVLDEALWQALERPFVVDLVAFRDEKLIAIDVELDTGVLHVLAPRRRLFSSTTYVFVIWMVGSSILLFGVATVFLHNQVRSIRKLAQGVEAFGRGHDVPDLSARGAFELRQTARAFNLMRDRIRRQIQQRTEMLAGVSHDLRTPLARLKLQLGMGGELGSDDVTAMKDDVTEMERMLDAYLAFARGDGAEDARPTDTAAMIEAIVARYRREGANISARAEGLAAPVRFKPVAMERCLGNLVGNAVRFGKVVLVTSERRVGELSIHVDDDGPGIPADKREEVFRAFTRLEPSRNRKTGGIGLGLTVAKDLALGMGGDVTLSDSPLGGLRATITIPV